MSVRIVKYGSSVLRSPKDIGAVADDILSQRGAGDAFIVVVSAFEGRTTQLFEEARRLGLAEDRVEFAVHVSAGEYEAAAALLRALTARRTDAMVASPAQLGFVARGPRADGEPESLDCAAVRRLLRASPVLLIPGYSAVDADGQPILLGRGGSDLSAVHIGARLGARSVRLIKDVDAVYDRDPNQYTDAIRLPRISYDTALERAGKLIQPKALRYAAARALTIEIAALGKPAGTIIVAGL